MTVASMTPLGRSERFKDLIDHTYACICQILNGDIELIDPWCPSTADSRIIGHFANLQIPTIDCRPSLLLHRLGDSSEGNPVAIEEMALREKRLKSVFLKGMSKRELEHS